MLEISAAILTFGFNLLIQFIEAINRQTTINLNAALSRFLKWFSMSERYMSFESGIVSLKNVSYYILFDILILFVAGLIFGRKRWIKR